MMNRLQSLFDRLVGIPQNGSVLRALDYPVEGSSQPQFAAFEKPACWRRRTRPLTGTASIAA